MPDGDEGSGGGELSMGRVSFYGMNGEWMSEADVKKLKLGETIKFEITAYVNDQGRKLLDPEDRTQQNYVKLKVVGVNVTG